jgi:hypothetical protein
MVGRHEGRRQHGMIALDLAVGALARLAIRAAELLRTKKLGSIERDQRTAIKALEAFHAALAEQFRDRLVERGLQMRGMHRIEHRTDVIVGRDFRHAEQRMAIGGLAPLLERALIGQKRLRLREEQRKR